MAKFNFKNIYEDRIIQIEINIKKAINNKKWKELALLKAEKIEVSKLIEEIK
jgi:hypothetical protein